MESRMNELKDNKSKINYTDIKSSYIIKDKIFTFLDKKKLNLIIYNKELQNMCSIDNEDYRKISGKYKIDEKNGKGWEYQINTNRLLFEGEYLNGRKNGKGKEYNKIGYIKFECEYLSGKNGMELDIK